MQRIRLRFEKRGRLKYIGHLDVLDIFNRAIKMAKLPIEYSRGFNPHMLISFGSPLSLGIESISEYVDIDFCDDIDILKIMDNINPNFPEGMKINAVFPLNPPYKRIMSCVCRAKYEIRGLYLSDDCIQHYLAQSEISIIKKTKRKNELTDIKPDIFSINNEHDYISSVLSCGSFCNLKPELFVKSICDFLKIDYIPCHKISYLRTEIYGNYENEILSLAVV